MSKTPEGRVKDEVKKLLAKYNVVQAGSKREALDEDPDAEGWYYMPVQNGMGVTGIPDFVGHHRGRFFSIETKAPGKLRTVTANQEVRIRGIRRGGGKAFVTDGDLTLIEEWLR